MASTRSIRKRAIQRTRHALLGRALNRLFPSTVQCNDEKESLLEKLQRELGAHRVSPGDGDCYGKCRGGIGNVPGTAEALSRLMA